MKSDLPDREKIDLLISRIKHCNFVVSLVFGSQRTLERRDSKVYRDQFSDCTKSVIKMFEGFMVSERGPIVIEDYGEEEARRVETESTEKNGHGLRFYLARTEERRMEFCFDIYAINGDTRTYSLFHKKLKPSLYDLLRGFFDQQKRKQGTIKTNDPAVLKKIILQSLFTAMKKTKDFYYLFMYNVVRGDASYCCTNCKSVVAFNQLEQCYLPITIIKYQQKYLYQHQSC